MTLPGIPGEVPPVTTTTTATTSSSGGLLGNNKLQILIFAVFALGCVAALMATGNMDKTEGTNIIIFIIAFGLGIPVTVP